MFKVAGDGEGRGGPGGVFARRPWRVLAVSCAFGREGLDRRAQLAIWIIGDAQYVELVEDGRRKSP